jgi:tetratricopeptide (TPR) repeat protein
MARSFAPVTEDISRLADRVTGFDHEASRRSYRLHRREGSVYLRRSQTGFEGREANVVDVRVDYVIGSGNHARGLVHRAPDGRLFQLPVAWYAEGAKLAMAPGYDRPGHSDFRRPIDGACFFCHNAYPGEGTDEATGVFPARLPSGIDCARCHGSGAAHAAAARSGAAVAQIRAAILNPRRLSAERQLEVCMQCHLQPTSHPLPAFLRKPERGIFTYDPREPLASYMLFYDRPAANPAGIEVNHAAYRLRESKCFRASRGALVCTTCHNPHERPRAAAANEACRNCHSALKAAHTADPNCASCHMPKSRTADAVHVVMTDHRIVRRAPSADPLRPLTELHGAPYAGAVVPYYPPEARGELELDLAVAQVRDGSNLSDGAAALARAISRYNPRAIEYRYELGEALRKSGDSARASEAYRDVLRIAPGFGPAWFGLGQALAAFGRPDRAIATLEEGMAKASLTPASLNFLGSLYQQSGDLQKSRSVLEQAAARAPELPEPHLNLGVTLSRLGQPAAAEREFREAIRLAPELAPAHNNLAYQLAGRGAFAEARFCFEEALRLDPSYSAAHLGYARLLAARGERSLAAEHFRRAMRSPDEALRRDAAAGLRGVQ